MNELNIDQQRAVSHLSGPCMVLAGPGSGKTFTLTMRLKYMICDAKIPPDSIMVLTFSKKAAIEMQARFESLMGDGFYPVLFGTFHAVFYHILKQYNAFCADNLLTDKLKIVYLKQALKKAGVNDALDLSYLKDLLSKISRVKNTSDTSYERFQRLGFDKEKTEQFIICYREYIKLCKLDNMIDFDDMVLKCHKLLKENDLIAREWQSLYRYFLIDEFQDVNDLQYEVIKILAGEDKNIFAVGDDDQSIYGFRGSKPCIMQQFIREFEDARLINLSSNYRSAPVIVASAQKLISRNRDRIDKTQKAALNRPDGLVEVVCVENIDEEAAFVMDKLKDLTGYPDSISDTAVLFRSHGASAYLEEKLIKNGINYVRKERSEDFYGQEWVEDILCYLKLACGDIKRQTVLRILNRPFRGLSREEIRDDAGDIGDIFTVNTTDKCVQHGSSYAHDIEREKEGSIRKFIYDIRAIGEMSPFAAVNYILKAVGYSSYLGRELMKRGFGSETLLDKTEEILLRAKDFGSISGWLSHIDKLKDNARVSRDEPHGRKDLRTGLILESAHASKGLEYKNVFIIGLQEGIFPHNKAVSPMDIEEERRLLYVAMTRAKEHLYIIGRGSSSKGKRRSRFIDELLD